MFKGLRLLLVPRINSGVEKYQLKLWRDNGAEIKDLRWLNGVSKRKHLAAAAADPSVKNAYIVVNSLAKPDKQRTAIEHVQGKNVYGIPLVTSSWLSSSLAKKRLLPYEQFVYELEAAAAADQENAAEESPRKRKRAAKRATKEATKDLPGATSSAGKLNHIDGIISVLTRNRDHKRIPAKQERLLKTNQLIISQFEKMSDLLELEKNVDSTAQYKQLQYNNAIQTLKTISEPIESSDDLKGYYGFGKSMLSHVDEILRTGTFEKYTQLQKEVDGDESMQLVQEICQVHGFGPATAYKLVENSDPKVTSVSDLESNHEIYDKLTSQQKLGLKYRADWSERIKRREVTEIYDRLLEIVRRKPLCEGGRDSEQPIIKVTGSYLRGQRDCGDIDCLVYLKGENRPDVLGKLLYWLVRLLEEEKFVNCELTEVSEKMHKFLGGCVSRGKCRRIDFIVVPYNELGSSMLYFVGNDTFNRGCRMLASLQGQHLSDKGLFKADEAGTLVESRSESRILELLGVGWVDYWDRNV